MFVLSCASKKLQISVGFFLFASVNPEAFVANGDLNPCRSLGLIVHSIVLETERHPFLEEHCKSIYIWCVYNTLLLVFILALQVYRYTDIDTQSIDILPVFR